MDSEPPLRFLTASLHVDYLRPTPLGVPLEIRGRIEEVKGRKVVVTETLSANGEICARGRVVAVQVPQQMWDKLGIGKQAGKQTGKHTGRQEDPTQGSASAATPH